VKDLNQQIFQREFEHRQRQEPDAIATHLPSYNSLMMDAGGQIGHGRGWLCVWAALPGMGKSISAIQLAVSALEQGESVAYVSLEMSQVQVASRYYAIATGMDVNLFGRGHERFNERAWTEAKKRVQSLPPMYVPDTISSDWSEAVDFIREAVEEKNASMVIFDYLQLASSGVTERRLLDGISQMVTDLRQYTVEKEIVTILLSQFNRQTAVEMGRPRASGLHGGSIIENCADVVTALSHHAYKRDPEKREAKLWACVLKNRHGSVGDIPILQSYRTLQQREPLEDEFEEGDWPTP
tara:strand:- start:1265 stop:2152 length:888 start_codon:yes stop_codon:yes gene_type:complete